MIFSINSDNKTKKGLKFGYLTGILYLAPAKLSGINVCTHSSPGCRNDCLFYAGRGRMQNVHDARMRKTDLFHTDKEKFKKELEVSIDKLIYKAKKIGFTPCLRFNGTSDLKIEEIFPSLFKDFSDLIWYDYTKIHQRMYSWLEGNLPDNYHLTFSRHEKNKEKCLDILSKGGNVAVVFDKLPKRWHRFKVYDGDVNDLRFLDGRSVCGLKAKGKAKKSNNGFVVRN